MIVWIVGLSGSGKTTIGKELYRKFKQKKKNTVLLDGDEIREVFKHDDRQSSYTIDGRRTNAERIVALCEMLDKQEINVVCCILSIFEDIRQDNRNRFGQYYEVFVDVELDKLKERDIKNLYAPAMNGEIKNVVGIDIPFQKPINPDMVLDNNEDNLDVDFVTNNLLEAIESRIDEY